MEEPLSKYMLQAFRGFLEDPPETDYQRGYLAALIEVSRIYCPGLQVPEDVEALTKAAD